VAPLEVESPLAKASERGISLVVRDSDEGSLELHCFGHTLWQRLKEEFNVLKKVFFHLVLYIGFLFGPAVFLFRNFAFYQYRGLDYYADLVAPTTASMSVKSSGAVLINTASGDAKPLWDALPIALQAAEWNISVTNPSMKANLTALRGKAFNLKDLGHDVLWDLSTSAWIKVMNENVAMTFAFMTYAMCCVTLLISFRGMARPHCVAMWHRLFRANFTLHCCRVLTYLSTSLPGTALHCQSVRWTSADGKHGSYENNQQHVLGGLKAWFFDDWNFKNNSNCGDLNFSGHTGTAMTHLLIMHYYAGKLFPTRTRLAVRIIAWSMFCCQVFTVLTSHNHYTVDVVIAVYLAPLNFIAHLYFFPDDVQPDQSLLQRQASNPSVPLESVAPNPMTNSWVHAVKSDT